MKTEPHLTSVRDLLTLKDKEMLRANPEYQRGNVWNDLQRKKLIDSVMRGYPIPLIYLHRKHNRIAGLESNVLEIVDGQQRLESIWRFSKNAFKLLDPVKDDREARFPKFVRDAPCPWAHHTFEELDPALRERFLDTQLAVVHITTEDDNEARDLFIRLQGGLPLTPQEKRDAWPGNFTDYILRLGGKEGLVGYQGHPFFRAVMKMSVEDRGKMRQLAAQMAMLYYTRKERGPEAFVDLKSSAIDDFYYNHLDFDTNSSDARRFNDILDKLVTLLANGKRPKVRAHEAIHAMLLLDQLWDGFTRSWEDGFADAFDRFNRDLAEATRASKESGIPDIAKLLFWVRYGQKARTNSDMAESIRDRHAFYVEQMMQHLNPEPKDPRRAFTEEERRIVHMRDLATCAVCGAGVEWSEAEVHHIKEHARGGKTKLSNGILVHRACHPKGQAALAFEEEWRLKHPDHDVASE